MKKILLVLILAALLGSICATPTQAAPVCQTLAPVYLGLNSTVYSSVTVIGTDYTVTISGTGTTAPGQVADAFYYSNNNWATQFNGPSIGTGVKINGYFPSPVPTFEITHIYVFTIPGTGSAFSFRYFDSNGSYSNNTGYLTVEVCYDDGEIPPGGEVGLIRPLAAVDENPEVDTYAPNLSQALEVATFSYPNMVYAFSEPTDAYVMAADSGTIIEISPFETGGKCSVLALFRPDTCFISVNPANDGEPWALYESETMANSYMVVLQTNTGEEIEYYVRNANLYVNLGSQVSAGCVLGETIPFIPTPAFDSIYSLIASLTGVSVDLIIPGGGPLGITMLGKRDFETLAEYAPLIDDLTEYGLPDEACNLDPRFSGCMVNNPMLKNGGDGWETWGPVTWFNETNGAVLSPGSEIYQQMSLENGLEYTLIVTAYPTAQSMVPDRTTRLTLRLGDTVQDYLIQLGDDPELRLTTNVAPDISNTFYTVAISNTGNADIVVAGVCLGDGTQELANTCTVLNSGFDLGIEGWVNDTEDAQWSNGQVWLPHGGTLEQDITLTPDSEGNPQTWIAEIEALVWAPPDWDGSGATSLDVTWPGEVTPVSVPLSTTWNQPGNLGYPDIPELLTTSIEISAVTSGTFTISPTMITYGELLGVKIERVCIHPAGQTTEPPPFGVSCSTISQPQEDTIGAWISYHWNQLDRFFQCELMVFLNRLYQSLMSFFKTVTWSIRWFLVTTSSSINWGSQSLLPWLNGHFANMAAGRVTYIDDTGDGGLNVWDVLFALIERVVQPIVDLLTRLVGGAADILFNVINSLISFFFAFLGQIISFIGLVQSLLGSIIVAFNTSTALTFPGAPACDVNPQGNVICIGIWVMDNTVFSGPGALIIPMIISIVSIRFLIWAARDVKKAILSIGNV